MPGFAQFIKRAIVFGRKLDDGTTIAAHLRGDIADGMLDISVHTRNGDAIRHMVNVNIVEKGAKTTGDITVSVGRDVGRRGKTLTVMDDSFTEIGKITDGVLDLDMQAIARSHGTGSVGRGKMAEEIASLNRKQANMLMEVGMVRGGVIGLRDLGQAAFNLGFGNAGNRAAVVEAAIKAGKAW